MRARAKSALSKRADSNHASDTARNSFKTASATSSAARLHRSHPLRTPPAVVQRGELQESVFETCSHFQNTSVGSVVWLLNGTAALK
jgi:hypothetical protein